MTSKTTLQQRIEQAEQRVKQLKAQAQMKAARERAAQSKKARQDDTRRKILAGAWLLDEMTRDAEMRNQVRAALDSFLVRADDRVLFGFSTSEAGSSATPEGVAKEGQG